MECDILTTALDNNDIATLDLLVSSGKYPLFKFVRITEKWLKNMLDIGSNIHALDFFEYTITMWNSNYAWDKVGRRKYDLGCQMQINISYAYLNQLRYKHLFNSNKIRRIRSIGGLIKILQIYGNVNYVIRTALNYIYEQRYSRNV